MISRSSSSPAPVLTTPLARRLASAMVLLGGALVASCSPETRTFSAGTGGAGGAGGSMGTGAPCAADTDCNDGSACNGVEACVMEVCKNGEPACPNPDPAHCEPACTEEGGPTVCAVAARDADGDGHADASCAAMPGDDCNDAAATAAPGQAEICDTLDNDCDGFIDTDDSLPLSGASKEIGGSAELRQSIAYSPQAGVYGVVHVNFEVPEIFFGTVDQSGAVLAPIKAIDSFKYAEKIIPRIAPFAGGDFGVVWHDEEPMYEAVFMQRVGSGGGAIGAKIEVSEPQIGARLPDIVAEEAGSVVVVWQNYESVFARRIAADGTFVGTDSQLTKNMSGAASPRIARLDKQLGVVWQKTAGTERSIQFARLDAGLSVLGVEQLGAGTTLGVPTIAADGAGYTIVFREDKSTFRVARRDQGGAPLCNGFFVAGHTFGGNEIVVGPSGAFVLETASDVSVKDLSRLVRLGSSCDAVGMPIRVSEAALTDEDAGRAVGVAGKGGFAVAWADTYGTIETAQKLMVRTFGFNFCD